MDHARTSRLRPLSRRDMLRQAGFGFGAWALLDLLTRDGHVSPANPLAANPVAANPLAARPPHFAGTARRVIFLFMQGGPSQLDTFDPKPLLGRLHGQPLPPS